MNWDSKGQRGLATLEKCGLFHFDPFDNSTNLDRKKCSSDIDLTRNTILNNFFTPRGSLTPEIKVRKLSEPEIGHKSSQGRHKRSKSTGLILEDFGFFVDPRTPSGAKSNSFPRTTPPVLKRGKKKIKKIESLPAATVAMSPSMRGSVSLTTAMFTRFDPGLWSSFFLNFEFF